MPDISLCDDARCPSRFRRFRHPASGTRTARRTRTSGGPSTPRRAGTSGPLQGAAQGTRKDHPTKLYALFITDYVVSTALSRESAEERDAAVREHIGDEDADVNDTLLFADLRDDGQLDAYSMDLDEFLSSDDDEAEDDA